MAWFNPQAVTFNPSPVIMEGANAIGKTMQDLYKQNYQEAQDKIKQDQANRLFGLQENQFDFQKGRADIQDQQWQQTYQAGRDDAQTRNEQHMADSLFRDMQHADTVKYQNAQLGNSSAQLKLLQDKAAEEATKAQAQGLFVHQLHPELFGTSKVNIGGIDEAQPANTYTTPDAKTLQSMSGLYDYAKAEQIAKLKEDDPYKLFMANIAGEKLKETQAKNAEYEKMNKVKQLQKQLSENPKSLLGVELKDLAPEDYTALISDINNGNIGSVRQEAGRFYGTNPRYVPFGSQSNGVPTIQKQIVERRQTKDGKILVKYSDGTIGEQ